MEFCKNCENMLYIRIGGSEENPTGPLVYYCRKCGNEQEMQQDHLCVSKIQLKRAEQKYDNIINEYTKLDLTLPHIYNIPCPNAECTSHKTKKNDVVYIRYDDINLKYVYLCTVCDTIWNNNNK
jgi:DNA-directed RNA polymerase subunit M/transcription elongation factor TFIIS